ncbi:long chronological lifespan 2 [Pyrenophora seminiperda CCB06]|uniref:Long chronological lifespan protein 2 n=1 Tax=Pyrenophora seminiperda CCB06 TaxID=1302712 RepID=A0A3M7M172_9PLEO|nr:long chronological lifespan 2 [Pyrenophora seminiperda CCB06]
MPRLQSIIALFLALLTAPTFAQFGFFDQMFGGGGGQQQQQHQHQEAQNVRSDASWYQAQYEAAQCTHYLCPGTLSCVHFPHHCPCAWENVEDKVELGEGIAVCGSKGGWVAGEFAKKVEFARRGVL